MKVIGTESAQRLDAIRETMAEDDVDLLLISPSADLEYFTGYAAHPSERPTLLAVLPGQQAMMLIPELEVARKGDDGNVRLIPYSETQNPFELLVRDLSLSEVPRTVAITDETWSAVLLRLQEAFPTATFRPASSLLRKLRMIKSPEEVDRLRRAGAMADAAFDRLIHQRFSGRTEEQIAAELTGLMREEGLSAADWQPIVASGANSASPHHFTGNREIRDGDAVILDFGGTVDGYQADITRTVHVGAPPGVFREVYDVVRQAQDAGVEAARADVTAESVDQATRSVIQAAGYGDFFIHRTGHGVGLAVHEEPYIVEGNQLKLQPGMTFSVEPGVYLPDRFGVRIEDIVAVTESGAARLNNCTRDPVIVH